MRKGKIYILCLMLFIGTVCQAQKLNIKPYILYHQSISSQVEPVFYHITTYYIGIGGAFERVYPGSSFNKEFTLSTGLEYGLAIDYTFPNQLGFELNLGYFSGQSSLFVPDEIGLFATDWNYHSIAIRPLFRYSVINGKSIFTAKIGPSIHYVSASMNAFTRVYDALTWTSGPWEEKMSTCTFADNLNWGYVIGLEYNYQLSKHWSLALDLGYEQYKYTPEKATVEYEKVYNPDRKKEEILYVDKITIYETEPSSSSAPTKRLKESISFNNLYFGIGIKYNLWEK